jgi:glycosyltransferase involved in cell wall biosynthesis
MPVTPRVSVLIGAYNNAATLERAARSMLSQTLSEIELLIIDDGSSDGTAEVAARIAAGDPRARVVAMGSNVGIARSLNAGLREAEAPVVAVLDADDWSEPERLERQLDALERDADAAVVGVRMREVDEHGCELRPRTRYAEGDVGELLMRVNPIPNTAAAFRREAALELGGYDPRYRWATEYDLWLRLAERHRILALPDTLATRQMSSRSVAARREREQIGECIVMRLRAMRRRRSLRGAGGLVPYAVSYVTPLALKRALRRRIGQAP